MTGSLELRWSMAALARMAGVLAVPIALAVATPARAGPFDAVDAIDAEFVRGGSGEDDVRRVLGAPDFRGDARLLPDGKLQQVWYYREQKVHSSQWNPELRDGKILADVEERALYVFFSEGRYDGYLWYGVAIEGDGLP